jgi:signal transduction histidine kinase
VDLELHGLEHERMAPAVESAVFCVVQETLSNVAKYARASRVSTIAKRLRRQLVGSIEGDSMRFDAGDGPGGTAGRTRWGRLGMQERVEVLGGVFASKSTPGQGTSVLLRIPLSADLPARRVQS